MISGWGLLRYTELKATIFLVLWWVWGRRSRNEKEECREEHEAQHEKGLWLLQELVGLQKQQIAETNHAREDQYEQLHQQQSTRSSYSISNSSYYRTSTSSTSSSYMFSEGLKVQRIRY